MIRVLIADDQEMVRAGFRLILESREDIEVIADVANGLDAVRIAREQRPDVVLMDIRMPGMDGLEATKQLVGQDEAGQETADRTGSDLNGAGPIRVVVVTTFDLDEYVSTALANGASGFLLKDAGPALLIEAVHAAVRGDALISPQITVRLLRHFTQSTARSAGVDPLKEELTDRERDVVRATARGLTNVEIGQELFMSLSTVKTHLASAQGKINARNRVETASWAWRTGMMSDA